VTAFRSLHRRVVLDGEIIVATDEGANFDALLQRLHPASSRVERLSRETPASFVAFDILWIGDEDFRDQPFTRRREALVDLIRGKGPPLFLTPATDVFDEAAGWLRLTGRGIDGVIAKDPAGHYESGRRALIKVKLERTADCVVGGFRWHHSEPVVGSLLLGLFDGEGVLRHVGLTASFTAQRRISLLEDVRPFAMNMESHPWRAGFPRDHGPAGRLPGAASRWGYDGEPTWVPLSPELVCEVAYDHLQGKRFRHPPRFSRWRPDRDPRSCTYDQFDVQDLDLAEFLITP
jgi:ATP-dependent DNA ligase